MHVESGTISVDRALGSVFYHFLPVRHLGLLVVVCETGLRCFEESGRERWRFDTDLVQQVRLLQDRLIVQVVNGPPVAIAATSGQAQRI